MEPVHTTKPENTTTKVFMVWMIINALVPLSISKFIEFNLLSTSINRSLVLVTVLIITISNFTAARKYKNYRPLFYGTIALNIIAFILIGALSIIDLIPKLPLLINATELYWEQRS